MNSFFFKIYFLLCVGKLNLKCLFISFFLQRHMKSISSKIWQRPAQGGAGHAVRVAFSIKSHKNALMCDVHSEMEKDVRKG